MSKIRFNRADFERIGLIDGDENANRERDLTGEEEI